VFGVDCSFPVSEDLALGAGTDWRYRSRIYHNAVLQDDPVQETPPYALGNAEVKVVTNKGRLTLSGYVRNLTDESYKVLSTVVNAVRRASALSRQSCISAAIATRFML
jgi:outer membrane receptor protein involved in Fe transport